MSAHEYGQCLTAGKYGSQRLKIKRKNRHPFDRTRGGVYATPVFQKDTQIIPVFIWSLFMVLLIIYSPLNRNANAGDLPFKPEVNAKGNKCVYRTYLDAGREIQY